jgi:hypothetical protein
VKYELSFYIPEHGILQSHRRDKLKFRIGQHSLAKRLVGWAHGVPGPSVVDKSILSLPVIEAQTLRAAQSPSLYFEL